ncbi:putative PT repeat protein, partial [Toxoplasma gondii TgCatPRC2]
PITSTEPLEEYVSSRQASRQLSGYRQYEPNTEVDYIASRRGSRESSRHRSCHRSCANNGVCVEGHSALCRGERDLGSKLQASPQRSFACCSPGCKARRAGGFPSHHTGGVSYVVPSHHASQQAGYQSSHRFGSAFDYTAREQAQRQPSHQLRSTNGYVAADCPDLHQNSQLSRPQSRLLSSRQSSRDTKWQQSNQHTSSRQERPSRYGSQKEQGLHSRQGSQRSRQIRAQASDSVAEHVWHNSSRQLSDRTPSHLRSSSCGSPEGACVSGDLQARRLSHQRSFSADPAEPIDRGAESSRISRGDGSLTGYIPHDDRRLPESHQPSNSWLPFSQQGSRQGSDQPAQYSSTIVSNTIRQPSSQSKCTRSREHTEYDGPHNPQGLSQNRLTHSSRVLEMGSRRDEDQPPYHRSFGGGQRGESGMISGDNDRWWTSSDGSFSRGCIQNGNISDGRSRGSSYGHDRTQSKDSSSLEGLLPDIDWEDPPSKTPSLGESQKLPSSRGPAVAPSIVPTTMLLPEKQLSRLPSRQDVEKTRAISGSPAISVAYSGGVQGIPSREASRQPGSSTLSRQGSRIPTLDPSRGMSSALGSRQPIHQSAAANSSYLQHAPSSNRRQPSGQQMPSSSYQSSQYHSQMPPRGMENYQPSPNRSRLQSNLAGRERSSREPSRECSQPSKVPSRLTSQPAEIRPSGQNSGRPDTAASRQVSGRPISLQQEECRQRNRQARRQPSGQPELTPSWQASNGDEDVMSSRPLSVQPSVRSERQSSSQSPYPREKGLSRRQPSRQPSSQSNMQPVKQSTSYRPEMPNNRQECYQFGLSPKSREPSMQPHQWTAALSNRQSSCQQQVVSSKQRSYQVSRVTSQQPTSPVSRHPDYARDVSRGRSRTPSQQIVGCPEANGGSPGDCRATGDGRTRAVPQRGAQNSPTAKKNFLLPSYQGGLKPQRSFQRGDRHIPGALQRTSSDRQAYGTEQKEVSPPRSGHDNPHRHAGPTKSYSRQPSPQPTHQTSRQASRQMVEQDNGFYTYPPSQKASRQHNRGVDHTPYQAPERVSRQPSPCGTERNAYDGSRQPSWRVSRQASRQYSGRPGGVGRNFVCCEHSNGNLERQTSFIREDAVMLEAARQLSKKLQDLHGEAVMPESGDGTCRQKGDAIQDNPANPENVMKFIRSFRRSSTDPASAQAILPRAKGGNQLYDAPFAGQSRRTDTNVSLTEEEEEMVQEIVEQVIKYLKKKVS